MLLRAVPWRATTRQTILFLIMAMLAALFAAWTVGPGTTRAGAGNGVNIAGHYIPIDPAGFLYVTNNTQTTGGVTSDGTTVDVFDESNNTLVKSLTVGHAPKGIARLDYTVSETSATHLFVANSSDGTVSMISDHADPTTDTVDATVGVGNGPWGVAADTNNRAVVVVNNASNSISVLDGASGSVLATLSLPLSFGSPEFVTIENSSNKAYVSDPANGVVYVIDITSPSSPSIIKWVNFTAAATNVVADQLGHVFVANNRPGHAYGTLNAIDTTTDTAVGSGQYYAAVGPDLFGLAYNSTTGEIATTSTYDNNLYRYTYTNGTGFAPIAGQPVQLTSDPKGIAFTDDGTKAYVAHQATGTLDQVNPDGSHSAADDHTPPVTTTTSTNPYPPGSSLTGTATDDMSGVSKVEVAFTTTNVAPSAAGNLASLSCDTNHLSCTWSYPVPSAPGTYYAWTRGFDRNADAFGPSVETWHSTLVTSDVTPPTSHITSPGSPSILIGGRSKVSGTATDAGSGVASVRLIFVQKLTQKTYNVPTTLSCNATAQSCTWTTTVPFDINLGLYKVYSQATDIAGNVEAPNLGLTAQIGLLTP